MITMGKWAAIRQLKEQGFGKRTIARMLGISRNTVRKALKQEDIPKYKRTELPIKKIDPFQEMIEKMLSREGIYWNKDPHRDQKRGIHWIFNHPVPFLEEDKKGSSPKDYLSL